MANPTGLSATLRTTVTRLRLETEAALARTSPVAATIESTDGAGSAALKARGAAQAQVSATVVANLGGNRYLVDIDGEQMPVVLRTQGARSTLESGATVRLMFLPDTPERATSPTPPGQAVPADSADLSGVGRMIAAATRPPPSQAPVHVFPPLSASPAESAELAQSLRQSVTESGLFYESHVAEWARGQRPLDTIQREPQAQLRADPSRADPVKPDATLETIAPALQTEPQVATLVREQLHTLATQQIAWRGEVWPEQNAEIELSRDPTADDLAKDAIWRATVRLTLPTLGEVTIKTALRSARLEVEMSADSESTRALLNAARPPLAAALEARGLVVRTAVQHG